VPPARSQLRFASWNTGVAPPPIAARPTAHRVAAQSVVEKLISVEGCSLVALTEVRREALLDWIPTAERAHWKVVAERTRPHDFDVAILYDASRLTVQRHAWERVIHGRGELRVALIADFTTFNEADRLVVALAHWRTD